MDFARRAVLGAGLVALKAAAQGQAPAAFPARPVRLIVPFAPGAATDILARTMAESLASLWPQPVIVENRTGASGNLGAEAVARAPKDGHTLLMGTIGTNAVNPALFARMPYDAAADFDPVIHVADVPMLLVSHPSLPVRGVADLVALARTRRLTMGTAGVGASQHLAALLFERLTGASFENVSYRGFAALIPDLLGGRLDIAFGDPLSILQQVRGAQLRALAVTTADRHALLPELPTIAEQGVADYAAAAWYGLFAPSGGTPTVLAKLRQDSATALARPEVQARIRELGGLPRGGSAEAFATFVRAEGQRWAAIIRAAGIQAE